MADFHRKIELQSTEDLQYLVANARRAAKEYLDKDFPPDLRDEGDNTLHERIERNVDDYINATFAAAAPNLTINGLDISPAMLQTILNSDTNSVPLEIEEHEPFDTRLFERAKMLARQEEELIEEIAMLRRTVPGKVVESRKKGFGEVERDESVVKEAEEKIEGGEGVVIEGLEMERQKNMEKSWEGAVKGVGGLMNTLPEVVARKERAEEAERYILRKKGKAKARK